MAETRPADPPPTPAVPLDYFEPRAATWRPAVELLATVLVANGWFAVGAFAWACGCFAWQAATRVPAGGVPLRGWPLVIDGPALAVSIANAIVATAVRRRPTGGVRRWLIGLAAAECAVDPLTRLAHQAYYASVLFPYLGRVSPYAAAYHGGSIGSAAYAVVFPAAVIAFLRRPEARAVFVDSAGR